MGRNGTQDVSPIPPLSAQKKKGGKELISVENLRPNRPWSLSPGGRHPAKIVLWGPDSAWQRPSLPGQESEKSLTAKRKIMQLQPKPITPGLLTSPFLGSGRMARHWCPSALFDPWPDFVWRVTSSWTSGSYHRRKYGPCDESCTKNPIAGRLLGAGRAVGRCFAKMASSLVLGVGFTLIS